MRPVPSPKCASYEYVGKYYKSYIFIEFHYQRRSLPLPVAVDERKPVHGRPLHVIHICKKYTQYYINVLIAIGHSPRATESPAL
jgi:hypothetical protein